MGQGRLGNPRGHGVAGRRNRCPVRAWHSGLEVRVSAPMNEASHAEQIADQCRQLGCFRGPYNKLPESLWYACIGVAAHASGGSEFAHQYSADAFSEAEIKDAFEFAQDLPPTTCERFQQINPEGCEDCPHKGKITSPIQLGRDYSKSSGTFGIHLSPTEDAKSSKEGGTKAYLGTGIAKEKREETEARPARLLDRFGWHGDSFLCGHRLYSARGVEQVELTDDLDIKALRLGPGTGSLAGWTGAANKLFAPGFEPVSFGLLCSFAAPLMRFYDFGKSGAIVSTYSAQSKGSRTIALNAAASVWGQVSCIQLDGSNTLADDSGLPITCDNVHKRDPEVAREWLRGFTDYAKGILLLSAPGSLVELLQFDCILEFQSSFPRGHFYQNDMEEIERDLFANSGWAGDAYLRYLVHPAVLEHVKNVLPLREEQVRGDHAGGVHPVWSRTIAACIVGGTIVRHLGLADFSLQRIVTWTIEQVKK